MERINLKQLKKLLDKKWAEIIKIHAGYRCEWCGKKSERLNAHHIFSKRNTSIRWIPQNGVCLCVGCHFRAHQEPVEFVNFIEKKLGKNLLEYLRAEANSLKKFKKEDFKNINITLSEELKRLSKYQIILDERR